jgi:UPF0271 protein
MTRVDLNADIGEGAGEDAGILPFVTSANVACGAHAGGPDEMRRAVDAAARHGVSVGAHPGFADRDHFGRREITLAPGETHALVSAQIEALSAVASSMSVRLSHVKPHGGLYHVATRDTHAADAVVAAVRACGADLIVVGAPGSELQAAASRAGLRFAGEIFADRAYGEDGRILPRSHPGALIDADDDAVAARALAMVTDRKIVTLAGSILAAAAHTLCLHGDDVRAIGRARAIRNALVDAGIEVAPLASWLR